MTYPTEDEGSRDDPLLSGHLAMPPFVPDADTSGASLVRVIPAIGALAANEWSPDNDPAAFATTLRKLLDE